MLSMIERIEGREVYTCEFGSERSLTDCCRHEEVEVECVSQRESAPFQVPLSNALLFTSLNNTTHSEF